MTSEPASMSAIWGTSRNLSARFDVTHSEILYARFKVGQGSTDLLARAEVGQDSQDLLAKFELQDAQDLFGRFEAQATTDLLGRFGVNQEAEDLLGKFEAQATANLLGKANIIHSEDLLGRFEAQATANLLVKFEAQSTRSMLGKTEIKNIDTAELLSKCEIQHSGSAELLGKFDAQIIQDLLVRFEVGQDSRELLGKNVIRHDGAPVDLPARFESQAILDLLARLEVGQDSTDLPARIEVGQDSADLLSKAVIIHPAYPLWFKAIFLIGLTNVHRDLESIIKLRHDGTPIELFGKTTIRHTGAPAELSGICWVPYLADVELPGGGIIKKVGSAELSCRFAAQNLDNLYAKFSVRPWTWDSVIPIFDDDLIFYLTYLAEIGQGFIGSPVIEMDKSEKMMGTDSFKITSSYEAGSYKEISFGWRLGVGLWPPASSYFNMIGSIWLQEQGGYHNRIAGSVGLFVDDPEGWGGAYFNR